MRPRSCGRICSEGDAELALCVLHRRTAGAGDAVDPAERSRIRAMAGTEKRAKERKAPLSEIFSSALRKNTLCLFFLNFFGLFAWWGLFTWIPPYLALPVASGGRGFSLLQTTTLLVTLNLVGMFPGYLSFGWAAERFGRKRSFVFYLLCAAILVPIYAAARSQWTIMVLGAMVAFFGTGFFSGSGLIGSELFPTRVRSRALGFTYNGARTLSALAPYTIAGWHSRGIYRGRLPFARDRFFWPW